MVKEWGKVIGFHVNYLQWDLKRSSGKWTKVENINGEYLNHFQLAEDIWLISESSDELWEALNDLNRESLNVVLQRTEIKIVTFPKNHDSINVKTRRDPEFF